MNTTTRSKPSGRLRQQRVDVAGHIHEGAPKTKSGERVIEVGRRSLEVLIAWRILQEIEPDEWGEAWTDTGYVFTREDGLPLRPETVSREFKRLTRLAGCDVSVCTTCVT
jgi:hypothetical protein